MCSKKRIKWIASGCVILFVLVTLTIYRADYTFVRFHFRSPITVEFTYSGNKSAGNPHTSVVSSESGQESNRLNNASAPPHINIASTPTSQQVTIRPAMTLIMRLTTSDHLVRFLYCQALRTITLYWAKNLGNVGLILDAESSKDKLLQENLSKHQNAMGINFKFYYEKLPSDPSILTSPPHKGSGYNRQIYSSFLMDLVIETPIIAWTDTDGKFTSPVTMENIFNGDKLRVKGMNALQHGHIRGWARITQEAIGKSQLSDFMEYFPVYIWKDTVTNCRNHIVRHMKVKDIDEAFKILISRNDNTSPVNIIMSYAYYFEKHRYDWHINLERDTLAAYNQKYVTSGFELTPADLTPDLHVTVHHKYNKDPGNKLNKMAYCGAVKNTTIKLDMQIQTMCQPYLNKLTWYLFKFNTWSTPQYLPTWCKNEAPECKTLLENHHQRVRTAISKGTYDLDLTRVKVVENAAKEFGCTCNSFF